MRADDLRLLCAPGSQGPDVAGRRGHITDEVKQVPGVSGTPLDDGLIRAAIAEAGCEVATTI